MAPYTQPSSSERGRSCTVPPGGPKISCFFDKIVIISIIGDATSCKVNEETGNHVFQGSGPILDARMQKSKKLWAEGNLHIDDLRSLLIVCSISHPKNKRTWMKALLLIDTATLPAGTGLGLGDGDPSTDTGEQGASFSSLRPREDRSIRTCRDSLSIVVREDLSGLIFSPRKTSIAPFLATAEAKLACCCLQVRASIPQ